MASTAAPARPPTPAAALAPFADRDYLDRAQKAVAGGSRRDQRIVLERKMNDSAIARRHRVKRDGCVLTLGLLGHRQRHTMQLAAAALAVGLGVQRDRDAILYAPRKDAIDQVLERIECLAVAADQQTRAVALDREFDTLGIFLGDGDLALFGHQVEDSGEYFACLARLIVETCRFAAGIVPFFARTFVARRGFRAMLVMLAWL